jgi:hypothetical protein
MSAVQDRMRLVSLDLQQAAACAQCAYETDRLPDEADCFPAHLKRLRETNRKCFGHRLPLSLAVLKNCSFPAHSNLDAICRKKREIFALPANPAMIFVRETRMGKRFA